LIVNLRVEDKAMLPMHFKILHALATRKPIISFDWIQATLDPQYYGPADLT